jgi:hypothetical protein
MSLGQTFQSAATLLQERAPGLDTGLSNVFRLNAANLPDTGNDTQARLGLANLQNSNSVASFGNADFSSRLMAGLNMADMERTTMAPSIAPGMGQ